MNNLLKEGHCVMYVGGRGEEEGDTLLCLDIGLGEGRSTVMSYLVSYQF